MNPDLVEAVARAIRRRYLQRYGVLPREVDDWRSVAEAALKAHETWLAEQGLVLVKQQKCPHGCRGTGWIGAGNEWGDTAALPCPIHATQPR